MGLLNSYLKLTKIILLTGKTILGNIGEPLAHIPIQGYHTAYRANKNWFILFNKLYNYYRDFEELTVMATMFQQIVYLAKIKMTQNEIFKKLVLKTFLRVFYNWQFLIKVIQPLAERIVFVNNNNYTFKTAIRIIESSTIKRRNKDRNWCGRYT